VLHQPGSLRILNIKLVHIEGKKNSAADGLSRTFFDKDCNLVQEAEEIYREVQTHSQDRKWFWKSGKGGYLEMLGKLDEKQKKTQSIIIAPVGWVSFSNIDKREETPYEKELGASGWYGRLYRYCRYQDLLDGNRLQMEAFKRKAAAYRWDNTRGKMIHLLGAHWVICVLPREVGALLQEVHDQKGHFSSKIVLQRIRYRVHWPKMAQDIRDYIEGCIQCPRHRKGTSIFAM